MPNKNSKKYSVIAIFLAIGLSFLVVSLGQVKSAHAQTFIQSYGSATALNQGLIVRLDPKDPSTVISASQTDIVKTLGVVVDSNDADVAFSNKTSGNRQVYVATTGQYNLLVNDENGPISIGDYVTVSSLDGIGMKADNVQPIVIGQALTSFNGVGGVIGQTTLLDNNKVKQTVHIGLIHINIVVEKNPLSTFNRTFLPTVFVKVAQSVAGKTDAPWRIYLAVGLLTATTIVASVMLYAGIRSSFISIGRNPLSHRSINKDLIKIVGTSVVVFLAGITVVYLLLKL